MTGNWHEIPIENDCHWVIEIISMILWNSAMCNANDIALAFHFDRIGRRKQTLLESLFYPMEGHIISMEIVVTFFPGRNWKFSSPWQFALVRVFQYLKKTWVKKPKFWYLHSTWRISAFWHVACQLFACSVFYL